MRANSTKDHGELIQDMIFKEEGKPTATHLFSGRDTITAGNGFASKNNEVDAHENFDQEQFAKFSTLNSSASIGSTIEWNSQNSYYYNDNIGSNIKQKEPNLHNSTTKEESFGAQFENSFPLEVISSSFKLVNIASFNFK